MTLDKSIEHGKEHRKKYYGAKSIDKMCRNHGGCSWCEENRTYKNKKEESKAKEKIDEFAKKQDIC